jgi:hypothetical protein
MSARLKDTPSPRRLELSLPASSPFLDIVDMAAHIYVSAVPGASALGGRVEPEILTAARALVEDGADTLVVILEYTSAAVRATVSGEGIAAPPTKLEWRV